MKGHTLTEKLCEVQLLRLSVTSINCLYFINARYVYVPTYVKITRQQKSALRVGFHCRVIFPCERT